MTGTIIRISGPAVEAIGLEGISLNEVVLVGQERLLGEAIRIDGDVATLQVYEPTAGLGLGDKVERTGSPLTVELGPGLLGGIFDGIQRPLPALAKIGGPFLTRGASLPALDRSRRWAFESAVRVGDEVRQGMVIGRVQETKAIEHRVLVPPEISGVVRAIRREPATVDEAIVTLDDGRELTLMQRWPVRKPRPCTRRLTPEMPFLTGQRVLDCFFPVAAGGTAIIPGGFGTGKTVLEQTLAKFAAADVVVYVGCGERGNEMAEVLDEFPKLTDPRNGAPLLDRTVMVVNTSNMPVAAREASIYTGISIAEYFRDMGYHAALTVDSTSRWAEALREISARLEEMPGEEGYPTYLATRLGQFYERGGRVVPLSGAGEGAVTVIGAVSPPAGDFSEPVSQASQRVSGAFWALTADLAHRRHFPAVDWAQSFSLDAERLLPFFGREAGPDWAELRDAAMRLLQKERELSEIVQLVGMEAIQDAERVVLEAARVLREGFLRQNAYHEVDASCPPAKARQMLASMIYFSRALTEAVAAGAPLRPILDAHLDLELMRLGEVPLADLAGVVAGIQQRIDIAVGRPGKAA